ncbi:hypothetical protein [Paraburkholderia sp.]|uniref:hypothetical protein n=1 Tax=Paraburkholderia sp. TaxID=1926495 RepID=UPI0039E4FC03
MRASIVKTDVPTLQEELDRKAFETLEYLTWSVDQGRITAEQFSTGVDVLFMTVSGLLKKDFIDLVTEAQKLCPSEPATLKRSFTDGAALMTVTWVVGADTVSMGRFGGKCAVKEFDTAREAKNWFGAVGALLAAKGYKEI